MAAAAAATTMGTETVAVVAVAARCFYGFMASKLLLMLASAYAPSAQTKTTKTFRMKAPSLGTVRVK